MQGGLEIHVQVTAQMDLTERNKTTLEKYKQILIVHSNCKESEIDKRPFRLLHKRGAEDDDSDTVQNSTNSKTWLLNCCLLSTGMS